MTIAEIRQLYREATAIRRRLDRESSIGDLASEGSPRRKEAQEQFYIIQDELKSKLNEILRENFVFLSKPQLISFLSMCSSHRPMEPHGVLTRLSMQYKEHYP